jgi:hypothetical protein
VTINGCKKDYKKDYIGKKDYIALGAANRAKAEERARLVTKGHEIATQWAARGEASRVSTQAELT